MILVSENVTGQALQMLWWKSWEGTPEEATSENRHRWCGRDVLGQTIPSTGSSNREGTIADRAVDGRVRRPFSDSEEVQQCH